MDSLPSILDIPNHTLCWILVWYPQARHVRIYFVLAYWLMENSVLSNLYSRLIIGQVLLLSVTTYEIVQNVAKVFVFGYWNVIRWIKTTLMTLYLTENIAAQEYWLWKNGICCEFLIDTFDVIVSICSVSPTNGKCSGSRTSFQISSQSFSFPFYNPNISANTLEDIFLWNSVES